MSKKAWHRRLDVKSLNFNTVAALGFIGFALFLFAVIPYQIDTPLMILGQSANALDPALFPRLVAAGLLVLGLWYLRQSFSLSEENHFRKLNREGLVNVAITLAAFLLYAFLMEPLGFVVSSTLLVGGLSVFYGVRNPALVVAVSLVVPVTIFLVFTRGLKVFLPEMPDF
jgi:putative tricarboxylic transport membrane protein